MAREENALLTRSRPRHVEALECRRLLTGATVVDLMVIYTPGAVSYYSGDVASLNASIQGAVDTVNDVMQASQIPVVIRLVHTEQVSYTGANDLYVDRTRLEDPSDGYLDNVPALRNQYGADLVSLVVENSFGGGNGSLPLSIPELDSGTKAFTACAVDSVRQGNYTLAHELGHNLGAGHERDNTVQPAPGIFSYSYGYRFTADGTLYHDVMSYDPGQVVGVYANPAISYKGVPTGVPIGQPNEADIASTFAITAPVVAGFRSTVVPDLSPPQAAVYETKLTGRQLDVIMRYSDTSGINPATLDDRDLTVTVPAAYGGFTLAAALVSIDQGSVPGTTKLVTYRVVLPDNDPPPSQLAYSLRSGAVSDSFGNVTSAGPNAKNLVRMTGGSYQDSRDLGTITTPITIYDSLSPDSHDDVYRIHITSPGTLDVHLDNLTADASIFLARDVDGDGVYNYQTDVLTGSFRFGTTPESFSYSVTPGEYFVWVYENVSTPYALSIRQYTDSVAPTATLDAADITAPADKFIFNVIYHDDQELNADLARSYAPVRLTNPFGGYYVYFGDSIDLDVNAATRTVTYRIIAGFTLSASDNGVYTVAMEPQNSTFFDPPLNDYLRDAAGNALVPTALGSFRVAIGQVDPSAPSVASVSAPSVPVGGAAAYDFTVTYRDNVGVNPGTLDGNDIRVTGPGGFNQLAQWIPGGAAPSVGGRFTATYRIVPPGGLWDAFDQGTYTISLQSGQVRDAAGNSAAGGPIGSFSVSVPLPGDANHDNTVNATDLGLLSVNWQQSGRGFGQGDFNFDGVVNVDDLNLLASHWQQTLVLPTASAVEARRPLRSPLERVAESVLG